MTPKLYTETELNEAELSGVMTAVASSNYIALCAQNLWLVHHYNKKKSLMSLISGRKANNEIFIFL